MFFIIYVLIGTGLSIWCLMGLMSIMDLANEIYDKSLKRSIAKTERKRKEKLSAINV